MSLIKDLEQYVNEVIKDLGYETDVKIEKSKMKEFGDYQINAAMSLAKQAGKNPREIAQEIVDKFDNRFTNVNIQGPGFINISISDETLLKDANESMNNFDNYVDKNEKKRKIVLDYGGANIAKEMHVGHFRCNIGEAVRRLLNVFGDETISDVHWGDWGTPMGLVIREIQEMYPELPYFDPNFDGEYPTESPVTNEELGVIYPRASLKKKEDEQYAEEAKAITERLQNGDKGLLALWKHIVNTSEKDAEKIYDYLNCKFDYSYGESNAAPYVNDVLNILKEKGLAEESDGALIMHVKEEKDNKEMPPLMLVKSDGAILYDTTELATIYQRMKDWNPDEIWYFTDERQSLHFEQAFRGVKKAGIVNDNTVLRFCGFGTINGKDGKPFKTRDGGVMSLKGLIKLVHDEIEPKIKEEITGEERRDIADKLTLATLKYSDLTPQRRTDYIFDVEKFTEFVGKTGIYAVYTTTRIKSLLNKVNVENTSLTNIPNQEVRDILVKLTELPKSLTASYQDASLNYICDFIYELSSLFNKFYGDHNISNETNEEDKNTYIALSKLVYNTLSNLLNILAIDEVNKM